MRSRVAELIEGRSRRTESGRPVPRLDQCPHEPSAKQRTFLSLACREAFYGGAAGGGKSEALLMAALQYVHVPGYAALILRKDTQRLQLAGGLIPRSQQWLAQSAAVWNEARLQWRFATGGAPATLSFGYLATSADKFRYGSSEYQYIAFDELTELAEDDYRFLFSRLRSTRGVNVPLRMRSASNPGGPGHAWVKARFISDAALAELAGDAAIGKGSLSGGMGSLSALAGARCDENKGRQASHATQRNDHVYYKHGIAFVPARIADNPGLKHAEYRRSLSHLPSVLRRQLEAGDWSVAEEGLIRSDWLRYHVRRGRMCELLDAQGRTLARVDERRCRRFATVDPAGTSEDRARERRGRAASWTVIQVWDQPQARELSQFLLLRHVIRKRVGFDGLCRSLRDMHRRWRPQRILIENEKLGRAACDVLRRELPIECIATGGRDKVTRAAPLIARLERGEIFLPRYENQWRSELEAEWLGWTGLDNETTDQIDAAAYAVMFAERQRPAGVVRIARLFTAQDPC